MLCEAVLLTTILDKNVKRMNIAMSSFMIMLLKVLVATSSYKYSPLPSTPPPPPPKKKSNVKVQARLFKRWIVLATG